MQERSLAIWEQVYLTHLGILLIFLVSGPLWGWIKWRWRNMWKGKKLFFLPPYWTDCKELKLLHHSNCTLIKHDWQLVPFPYKTKLLSASSMTGSCLFSQLLLYTYMLTKEIFFYGMKVHLKWQNEPILTCVYWKGMTDNHIISDRLLQDGKVLSFVFFFFLSVKQETVKLLHGVHV